MPRFSKIAVVEPPLPLSRHFIDYPWLNLLPACQVAAVLQKAGVRVQVVDGLSPGGLQERDAAFWLGQAEEEFLESLGGLRVEVVVIHLSPFLKTARGLEWLPKMLAAVAVDTRVILAEMTSGGMHYLASKHQELANSMEGVEALLLGQCERTLPQLLENPVPGGDDRRCRLVPAQPVDLPGLPPPAWELIDVEAYFDFMKRVLSTSLRQTPYPPKPARSLPVLTSRGCRYDCVFCTSRVGLGGDGRPGVVPLDRLAGWLAGWRSDLGLQRVIVLDDLANLSRRRFDGLLDVLERLDLRVEFPNGLRADLLTREQVLRLARLTGRLKVSLESASPRVQDEILGKHLPPAAVRRVAKWCHEVGLGLDVHLLVGLPGERISEVRQTLTMALELHADYGVRPLAQFPVPLPQTRLAGFASEEVLDRLAREPYPAFQHRPQPLRGAPPAEYLTRAVATLRRVTAERRLRKVIINLTYLCNNHCVFCAVGDRPRRHADTSQVLAALEEYRRRGFKLLDIDGGEPTLHPGLFEVIERARQLGYGKVTVVSNGRRLAYRAFARRFVQSGIDEVLISLHAPEARLQAQLSGSPDSFEQTTTGIANLRELLDDPRKLAVNTTIVADNLLHLGELGGLLAGLGIKRWNLQLLTPFGRARAGQVPEQPRLQAVLLELLTAPPEGMEIRLVNCPPCLVPGHEELASADFGKGARDMVFIGQPAENLQGYLSGRRRQDRRCRDCPHAFACPGWYRFLEEP